MGLAPEAKLIIKHTFLEYVGDAKHPSDDLPARQRSLTEPAILENPSYGEVREMLHGSDAASSSSSSDAEEAPWPEPAALALATPERTPLHGPSARAPWRLQDPWNGDLLLPEACGGLPAMGECLLWSAPFGDWWASDGFVNLPHACGELPAAVACEEIQGAFAGMQQAFPSADSVGTSVEPLSAAPPKAEAAAGLETRTTVMLRDLPEDYTRASLLKLLNAEGFFGRFDFVYLPVDFKHHGNLGYALVNLVSPSEALRLSAHFQNFTNWGSPSDRVCGVSWCSPAQGLEAHVRRYRNSPVMHASVPEHWRPLLLSHGVPIAFPPPTLKVKAPKVKGRQ